ncbi:MAG: chemotaxis protein CheW [Solirubrobacterales bacterium]
MASHLRLEVGPYLLLLPTDEVFEVLEVDASEGDNHFLMWRDQILPMVSMRTRLRLPDGDGGVVIVHGGDDGGRQGMLVDRVLGLVELDEADLRPIPASASAAAAYFDGVWTDVAAGHQVLRLRTNQSAGRASCDSSVTIH